MIGNTTRGASVLCCLLIVLSVVAVPVAAGPGFVASPSGSAIGAIDGQAGAESQTDENATVSPALQETNSDERLFFVGMTSPPRQKLEASSTPFETMEEHSRETSETARNVIERSEDLTLVRQFSVGNLLLVRGSTASPAFERLKMTNNVERLFENFEVEQPEPVSDAASAASGPENTTYGLDQIDTVEAWNQFDTRGENAKVAVLDTGVDASHPDISLYTENASDPTYPGGWAEFNDTGAQLDTTPRDDASHGTHTSGTVSGGDASGEHIGVAPNVSLMHGMVLGDSGGTFASVIAGMNWAVREDADVISMSLGATGYLPAVIQPVRDARAAGTFVVVSSGNAYEGTTGSPGNVYDSLAVGASDSRQDISVFSSGEVINTSQAWGEKAPEEWPEAYVVPDVSAPGVGVKSSYPNGEYERISGTSMAAPHVAGVVGLIRSAEPNATMSEIETALESTATQPEDAPIRKDVRYGAGIVDTDAAISAVADDSAIEGTVTSEGEPLAGATVELEDGPRVRTDKNGSFSVPAEPGTNELTVSKFGFETVTRTVTVETNATTTVDAATEPTVDAEVIVPQNDGIADGDTASLRVEVANVEELTVDLAGNYTTDNATLRVAGSDVPFGDPISADIEKGTVPITVETTEGATGEFSLEHTIGGAGDELTVTTGPTTVADELVDVALVDTAERNNAELASSLETELPPEYTFDTVDAANATAAIGQYDAFLVQNFGNAETAGEFMETTNDLGIGVVLLDQAVTPDGYGASAISQASEATDWPKEVNVSAGGARPTTYELAAEHPIVDSVGEPGERVTVHHGWFPARNWVEGIDDATVLANAGSAETTDGAGLVVDEERNTVLAASLGRTKNFPNDEYTTESNALLANSIEHVASTENASVPAMTLEDAAVPKDGATNLTLGTTAADVAGYQANVTFDPEAIQVTDVNGADLSDPQVRVDNDAGFVALAQADTTGTDEPDLAEIRVESVGQGNQSTTLSLQAENSLVNDPNGETIRTTYEDGTLDVASCVAGDVNDDGAVTSGDATLVLRHIVGEEFDKTFNETCADVNDDGDITSADATGILQKVVGSV